MKFPIFFAFSVLMLSAPMAQSASSVQEVLKLAAQEKWHEDIQWRKLMHFERGFFGGMESQIDGDDFFLSPDGSHDLEAELKATLTAFISEAPKGETDERKLPLCHFPARFAWVQKKSAGRVKLPVPQCPRFDKFFKALRGTGVSLVFSSYYLNNPSSAFGHTFLRVNKAPASNGKRYELLDYGLNYAANRDTENSFIYAMRGLFGLGPGTFTTTPYYYKVREYNDAESRDLWEYELNVSPQTVDLLVAHMWEVGSSRINYWYLTENCSYHMFTLLEAADPTVDLTSHLKKYVIPSDTVQVAWNKPDFIKSVHYRPSVRTELLARAQALSQDERDEVFYIMKNRDVSESFAKRSETSKMNILDTTVDYIDYRYAYEIQIADTEEQKFKGKILGKRSQVDKISEILKIEPSELEKPHLAHGSRRLGIGYADSKETADNYLLEYRFSLHDQMDPIVGYPEYAKITFFDLKFSIEQETKALQVDDWTLFEVLAMSPLSVRNENCDYCRWSGLTAGIGATWEFTDQPLTFGYVGVRATGNYGDSATSKWWAGIGPDAQIRIRWNPRLITLLEAWQRVDFQGAERNYFERSIGTQWSWSKTGGVRGYYKDYGFDKVGIVQSFYYY
jgi:hypothetical protein